MEFASIFISPKMSREAMEREISAVDSEFVCHLQDDLVRLQGLQCHTARPGHPLNRFLWGNRKSLSNATSDSNIQDRLMKLHNEYCCAELMKLVVIGGESLEVLESWVNQLFSSVKRGSLAKNETSFDGPIWKGEKIYKLEAVGDVHILELSWPLPSQAKDYQKKSEEYIAHLLGHGPAHKAPSTSKYLDPGKIQDRIEGKGSIFYLLKTRGWASQLSAGVSGDGIYSSSIAYILRLIIHLSDDGVEKIFEVIDCVYQYIKQIVQLSPQK
ncbi:hypothetical protein OROHE_010387 [Orobanche hederae]